MTDTPHSPHRTAAAEPRAGAAATRRPGRATTRYRLRLAPLLRPLSHAPDGMGAPPRTARPGGASRAPNRQQRHAVRSRRLELAAAVAAATAGLWVGLYAPADADADGGREARAASSAVQAPAGPPGSPADSGPTADVVPISAGSAGEPATSAGAPLPRAEPLRVRIPQLATDVDVFGADLAPDGGPSIPSAGDAMRAAWYAAGVSPGERGAAILVGRLDTDEGPAAFAGLGRLRPGETIEVDRADGSTAMFVVDSVERYPKAGFPDQKVYGAVDTPQLRLITCGEGRAQDGGDDANIVASAHLAPDDA